MRGLKALSGGLILLAAFWLFACWSGDHYREITQPTGLKSIGDYYQRFGEPTSVLKIQVKGVTYYRVVGHIPKSAFTNFRMPSSRPAYLFDEFGRYVDWCEDPGDDSYPWPKDWNSTGEPIDLKTFEKQFGIENPAK